MDITLTDDGLETRIIYEFKRQIGDFEAYKLLEDEGSRGILRRIYQRYAQVAVRYGLPIHLGTPTWRASRKWTKNFGSVNAAAVELLRAVRQQFSGVKIILAGVIGPASDGYATDEALSADAAFAYHCDQADVLAGFDVVCSTRRPFHRSQSSPALPAPWHKAVGHMPWRRCCTLTGQCSMERHSRMQSLASMPRSLRVRNTI